MTDNVIPFTHAQTLVEFLAECCARAAEGAAPEALRDFWNAKKPALRSGEVYDDLIEFFIAVDDATRPLQPGATELLPLPEKLRCPPGSSPRLVSPLGQYARERYGGFAAAYPYVVPLQAIFGDDDPALLIARAGRALFPAQDPYPLEDIGRYDDADLASFGIAKANRWLIDELLGWAATQLEPRLIEVLRIIADGKIEECSTPEEGPNGTCYYGPGGVYDAQTYRIREMLTLYIMRRALSDGLVSSMFHYLAATEYDEFLGCTLEPGGALDYCLSPRNLDSLVRAANRVGTEADAEGRPDKEYFVLVVLDAIARRSSLAPFSLATSKRILDRLVEIGHWEGLGGLIRSIASQRDREVEIIEPYMLGVLADSLEGGEILAPPRRFAEKDGVESFLAHGLTKSQLKRVLDPIAVNANADGESLVLSSDHHSNDFLSADAYVVERFVERYRYAIDQAVWEEEPELASSLVAFLIFAVGYRTGGTFRGRSWSKAWLPQSFAGAHSELSATENQKMQDAERKLAEKNIDIDGTPYSPHDCNFHELLALVPVGLGLKGRERVEKAVRALAVWAKAGGHMRSAERLQSYVPRRLSIKGSRRVSAARLVAQGESHTVEFKETIRFDINRNAIETSNERVVSLQWLKAMAALINADGGHLLIGVADDGTVHGLDRDGFDSADKRQRFIRERIDTVFGPNAHAYVKITEPVSRGQRLVHIQCRPAAPEYVWFHPSKGSAEQLWVRTGPKVKQLEGRALAEFLAKRAAPSPKPASNSEQENKSVTDPEANGGT